MIVSLRQFPTSDDDRMVQILNLRPSPNFFAPSHYALGIVHSKGFPEWGYRFLEKRYALGHCRGINLMRLLVTNIAPCFAPANLFAALHRLRTQRYDHTMLCLDQLILLIVVISSTFPHCSPYSDLISHSLRSRSTQPQDLSHLTADHSSRTCPP